MTLNERMKMLRTKFDEKNKDIYADENETSNADYARMMVEEAYRPTEQALNLQQRILDMEQRQLITAPNPHTPDMMSLTMESMLKKGRGVNSTLKDLQQLSNDMSRADEFENKRELGLAKLGLERLRNLGEYQKYQYEKERATKNLVTQANINTVDDAVNGFGASLLSNEDPMNYGFWNNVGANTVGFLGTLSKGLATGVKGFGDVVETSGRLASRALPWSEDDPTLHRPEDGEDFVANMKMLGRHVAKDWQTSVENDQLTKPFQEALNWGGNKLLEAKRDMRAESLNTLEDLKRLWNRDEILPIEALSTFLGMAGESFINPETAAVIATGPLGWGAKAAALAGVATSKAGEMVLDRREAEARMNGLNTSNLYKDQISLNEFLAQTPYALGYAGLNYLEINGLFKLMGSNFVPKNFLKADIKQVADYALKRLPAEEMEAIAKTGFKSAAENAWSLNKLNPFIRKAAEQAPEIVGFGGLAKHIGKQAVKGAVGLAGKAAVRAVPAGALEGGVEYLQTHLELANARPDLSDPEKEKLAREAGISGALVGGAIGGTAGVARGAVQSTYNFTKDSVDNAKHIKSKEANKQIAQELAEMSDVKATTKTDNRTPEVQSALDLIEKYVGDTARITQSEVNAISNALGIIGQTNNVDRLSPNTQEVIKNTYNKALDLKTPENKEKFNSWFFALSNLEKIIVTRHMSNPKFIEQFIKGDSSTYGTSNSRVNNTGDDVTEKNYKKFLNLVKTVEESGVLFTKSQANAVRLMASEVKNNILRGYSNEGVSNTSNDVFMFGRTDTKNVKPSMIQYLNALMSRATSKEAIVNIKNRLNSFKVSHANKLKLARYAKNYIFKDTDGDVITVSIPKLNPSGTIQKTQGQVNKKDVQDSHIFHIHRQAVKNKFIQSIDSELEQELNAIQTMEELADERLGTATRVNPEPKQNVKGEPIIKKPSSDEKEHEEKVTSTKKGQENVKVQPTESKETKVNKDVEVSEVPFEENDTSFEIQEHPDGGYRERTIENVRRSDATIAFAQNFNTPGEILTRNTAKSEHKPYLAIDIDKNGEIDIESAVRTIVPFLKQYKARNINIAGNAISRMSQTTQEKLDEAIYKTLEGVNEKYILKSVRSGGQTGVDEAGAKAGRNLNIKTTVLAPKGYLFTGGSGKEAFEARFNEKANESNTSTEQEKGSKDSLTTEHRETKKEEKPNVEQSDIIVGKGVEGAKKLAKEGKGLYTLRVYTSSDSGTDIIPTLDKDHHFGNPFFSTRNFGSKGVGTDTEVSQMYYDWLTTDKHNDVEPNRREWIREQISNGNLDNVPLIYYANTPVNHAKMLNKIVRNRKELGLDTKKTKEEEAFLAKNYTPILEYILPDEEIAEAVRQRTNIDTEESNGIVKLHEYFRDAINPEGRFQEKFDEGREALEKFFGKAYTDLTMKLRNVIPMQDTDHNLLNYTDSVGHIRIANAVHLLEDERARASILFRSLEWLMSSPMNFTNDYFETREAIQKLFGIDEVPQHIIKELQRGEFESSILEDIGHKVLNDLGVKPLEDKISQEQLSLIEQELGLYGVRLLLSEGYITQHSFNRSEIDSKAENGEAVITYYKLGKKKIKEDMLKRSKDSNIYKDFLELADALKADDIAVSSYLTEAPEKNFNRRTYIKGKGVVPITDVQVDALNTIEQTPFVPLAKEKLTSLMNNASFIKILKKALGYKHIANNEANDNYTDSNYVLPSDLDSVRGKNLEIDNSIEHLQNYLNSEDSNNPIYFKAFMSKNSRYFLASSTINPQANKLHRFFVVPKQAMQTYEIKGGRVDDVFYQSMAQAFGFSTDKKSTKEAIAFGEDLVSKMLKMDEQARLDRVIDILQRPEKYSLNNTKIEIENPSHAIMGLFAINDLANVIAENKNSFDTVLTTEIDAINNGLILKSMQYASSPDVVDNLAAGGVVFGTTDTARINDRYAQGENDLYKLFAKKITELRDAFTPNFEHAFQFLKIPKSEVLEQMINKIAPELIKDLQEAFTLTDEGNVSSKARSLAKPTSTVFGYGSGDKSSVLNLVNELIYGRLRGIKSLPRLAFEYVYQGNKEGEAAYNLFRDMLLETAVANSGKNSLSPTQVQAIENEIKKALVSEKGIMEYKYTFKVPKRGGGDYTKITTLGHALKATYYSILKTPLINALDKMYLGMSFINDLVNTAVNSRLEAQNELYAKKKQEKLAKDNKKTLTIKEDKELWKEVEKELPKPFFYFQPKSYKGTNAKVEMWDTRKVINPNFSQTLGVMRINGVDTKSSFKYVSKTLNGKEKQRSDVGASANVGMIHQADGVAMANTLNDEATKDMGLLPIHDAVSVSSKNAKEANQTFNRVAYEDSMERDVLEQAVTMARGTEAYSTPKKRGKPVEGLGNRLELAHYVSAFNKILLQNASVNYDNIQNGIEGSEYSEVKTIDSVEELKNLMATFMYDFEGVVDSDLNIKIPEAIEYFKSKGKDDVVSKLERINRKVNKSTTIEKESKEATKEDLDNATKEVKEIFSNSDPEVLDSYIEQATKDALGTSNTERTLFRDDEVLIEDFDGNVEKIYEAQNTVRELDKLDGVYDEEHSKHLDNVLKEVVGVNPEAMKGLKVALENSEANENEGLYDLSNNKINISSGTNTSRVSPSREETYAHEIVHAMTVLGLKLLGLNSRSGQYLKAIHKQAISKLSVEDFLPEVSTGSLEEDMKLAKRGYDYLKNNDERGLSEFITMGLTNKKLVSKLKSIEFIQRENKKEGMNLFERMVEGVKDLMANAFNLITKGAGRNKTLYDALLSASMKIANANNKVKAAKAQRISTVGALIKGVIETGNERINTKVDDFIKDLVENKIVLRVNTNPKTWFGKIKLIVAAQTLGALDPDTRERYYKLLDRLNIARYGDSLQTLSQDFHKPDKFGRTVEQFIATSNRIDAAKMVERYATAKALKEGFTKEPTKEESQALGKAIIDTDLDSLMDRYSLDDVHDMLSSESALENEIKTIRNELQEAIRKDINLAKVPTKEFMTYIDNQSNGLAYYMVTNKVAMDGQFLNAENIAKMGETKYSVNKVDSKVIDLIDKLTTLKALEMSTGVTSTLRDMIKTERKGVQGILTFIKNYKQDSDRKLFKNSSFNKVKGYRSEKLDNGTDFLIARVADADELKTEGYEPISNILDKDSTDSFSAPRQFYRNTWISSQPTWNKAAVKLTSLQSKGHTLADLYVDDLVKGKNVSQEEYEKTLKNTTAKHRASLNRMFKEIIPPKQDNDISLLPIIDSTGHFQQFRYVMSKALKTTALGLDTDVFENLAIMESTKFDKVKTAEHNAEIADAIYEYWEENQDKKKLTPFVELAKYSTNERMRDIYRILPDSFLDRLKERFAGRPIMIRKDMINWLFGFRDIDISKTKPMQRIQNKHFRMAFKIGDALVRKLTKVAKAEVVVKSTKTILSNIISNLNQCIMQGCTPSQAFKDHMEGINALSEYRDNAIRLKVLKNKKKMGEKINEAEYNNLKRSLNNSPVKDMIEWGMFSSVVEDVEYNDKQDAFDTKIDKVRNRLLKPLKVGTDMLFITKETTMYQTLAKVLQYSDFVSRYALKKGLEAQGIKDKELIRDTIRDAFINYDLPMSPLRTALEQRGFFVFSKFFTRIQKVLTHDILGRKPIQGLLGIIANSKLGTGLETPFDSSIITKNYDVLTSNPVEMVVNAITPAGLNYIPK